MHPPARFVTLYSGSSGNAALVEQGGRCLLVDIGNSCKATLSAIGEAGLSHASVAGVLITHEHIDHVRGLEVFLRRVPVPVFASGATLDWLWRQGACGAAELVAVEGRPAEVEGFKVTGFPTSHDAAGCCGFRIRTPSGAEMAIATDLGHINEGVFAQLQNASLVALEANYDKEMLRLGRYPAYLKKRISSPVGHLSNEDSAAALAALIAGGCKNVSLCHLSEENNTPELALAALRRALAACGRGAEACDIQVAPRYHPGRWMEF